MSVHSSLRAASAATLALVKVPQRCGRTMCGEAGESRLRTRHERRPCLGITWALSGDEKRLDGRERIDGSGDGRAC